MSIVDSKEDLSELYTDWILSENQDLLSRRFELNTFTEALDLVNKIGKIAEEQGHHPDMNLGWGYVEIYLSTHDIGGISDKDIVLAKAIDSIEF